MSAELQNGNDAVESATARAGWIVAGATALLIAVMAHVAWGINTEKHARDALRRELNALSPPYRVTVNGRQAPSPDIIVNALREVARVAEHHSSPMELLELEIGDATHTIHVRLARDSKRPDEFWVYQNGNSFSAGWLGEYKGRVQDSRLPGLLLGRMDD